MYTHKFRDTNENKYSAEDNPVIIKMDFSPPVRYSFWDLSSQTRYWTQAVVKKAQIWNH